MKPLLFEISNLTVQAGGFRLHDISFSVDRGQYLIVLGPTGSGKTLLLETLAGLRKPAAGKIFLNNRDITSWPPEARSCGFAYQDSLLYPFLNVRENILFGARARKRHKEQSILRRLDRIAEAMGIAHLLNRFPGHLSGGEKQRVSLARAILCSPPVLLLDEPLSSLDPQTRRSMQELLQEVHQAEELGIIHVTHDFNEALQLGTRVLVMNNGKILQQGEPLEVFNKPDSPFVADFLLRENALIDKPNTWLASVEQVIVHGAHVELACRGSGCWQAVLSMAEWQKLAGTKGSPVKLSVDPANLHIISNV